MLGVDDIIRITDNRINRKICRSHINNSDYFTTV